MPPRRMVCKSFSFSSWFRPLEFASHFFRFDNVLRLRGLDAASQQNVDGRAVSRVIHPIPRSHVNTHLGNASPTGSQSPKFPNVALARRARILAFAFWRVARPSRVL